ncbi:hypothetical protein PAPHI01_2611 [Pancytospora philotis]|nr:hypothetical protein PAPHI01_2611 [Pancytospora philotis]
MAAYSCRTLTCALWALVGLASAYSDISNELRNGRDYGYSGSLEMDARTAVREISDGVFEVDSALVKLAAAGSDTDQHMVKSISLYESKTDGPADWKEAGSLHLMGFFEKGAMEFHAIKIRGGKPIILRTGYWYSIKFYSPRIKEHNCAVFIEPWQCPDLKPYTKRKPVTVTPDRSSVPSIIFYANLIGIPLVLGALALCGYGLYRCTCGSSKRSP